MRYDTDDDQYEVVTDHTGAPRRVLKNGGVVRVPLQLMDSLQRSVYGARINDATTFDDHLEGLRRLRDQAYRDREYADSVAWQGGVASGGHNLTSAGGREQRDAAASDPHSPRFNLDDARAARDAAYEAYNRGQENAWRGGGY
jgi:hypothetical protein